MKAFVRFWLIFLVLLLNVLASAAPAQNDAAKSEELADDGTPVLVKHLPDWEKERSKATFATDIPTLKQAVGERPILDLIDFTGGTEAVAAQYPAGKLVIVEYTNPQASIDADHQLTGYLSTNPDAWTLYRRIGNYNVFVFDVSDPAVASALIDRVRYEKDIQWLASDPSILKRLERAFVVKTTDLFISTLEVIVLGMGLSVIGGLIVGYFYFQFRERQRLTMKEFSDAGGMIRLNLDGLTPEIAADRLLSE